jgi:Ca2+-binding RTX toxin-like protein
MDSRRSLQRSTLGVIACAIAFLGAPAVAAAADNNVQCMVQSWQWFNPADKRLHCFANNYTYNPATPFDMTVTEAGSDVTIVVNTSAPGGFTVSAPCTKTNATTAVCPKTYAPNNFISHVQVVGSMGNNALTYNAPSLRLAGYFGNGNDTVDVQACTTSTVTGGAGNDTLIGGSGANTFYADAGQDFIDIDDGAADSAYCGTATVEPPSDIVDSDTSDTVGGSCLQVY